MNEYSDPPLTIEEVDGSPSVRVPRKLIVPNGSMAVSGRDVTLSLEGEDANGNVTASSGFIPGFTSTATAAGTTTLLVGSDQIQEFTGSTTQTVVLPVVSTLVKGQQFYIINNSSGTVTVNSSGGNLVQTLLPGTAAIFTCVLITGTTAASWDSFGTGVVAIGIACSDETTVITVGTAKATFRMPYAMTVTGVRASVTTAPAGSTIIIDINDGGTTILSTKLSIDATEKTSTTAATPAVISDTALADDAEITVDFDQVGSAIAGAGVKVWLIGTRV